MGQMSTYAYEAEDPKAGITINEMMAALQQLLDTGVTGDQHMWSENKTVWTTSRKGMPISVVHVVWDTPPRNRPIPMSMIRMGKP